MKTLTISLATTASAAIVAWYAGMPFIEATGVTTAASGICTVAWWIGREVARRQYPPSDVLHMMKGICPVCRSSGTLTEVTSTNEGSLVKCIRPDCRERFDVRASDKGPHVLRLGKNGLAGIDHD